MSYAWALDISFEEYQNMSPMDILKKGRSGKTERQGVCTPSKTKKLTGRKR